MRRLISLLAGLTLVLGLAGAASAGYWDVSYDLGPQDATVTAPTAQSFNLTTPPAPAPVDTDAISGTFKVKFHSKNRYSPIVGSSMGTTSTHVTIHSTGGLVTLTVTGSGNTNVINPGTAIGSVVGKTANLPAVPAPGGYTGNQKLHCSDGTPSISACTNVFGTIFSTPASVTLAFPLLGTKPWPQAGGLKLYFNNSGVAGSGDFTSAVVTQYTATPITANTIKLQSTYIGKEVSRKYVEEAPAVSNGGLVALGLMLVLGGSSTVALLKRRTS